MSKYRRLMAMIRHFPVRSVVYIGAPFVALALQFVISLSHGSSLLVPTAFALVVVTGSVITTRYHLAEFHVRQAYRDAGIEQG